MTTGRAFLLLLPLLALALDLFSSSVAATPVAAAEPALLALRVYAMPAAGQPSCSSASPTEVPITPSQVMQCLPTPSIMSEAPNNPYASMRFNQYDANSGAYTLEVFIDAQCQRPDNQWKAFGDACLDDPFTFTDYQLQIVPSYASKQCQLSVSHSKTDCSSPYTHAPLTLGVCSQTNMPQVASQLVTPLGDGMRFNYTAFGDATCDEPIGSVMGTFNQCTLTRWTNFGSLQLTLPPPNSKASTPAVELNLIALE